MSRSLQAKTNNVKIYAYNTPLGLTGKVFVLVNINDGETSTKSTGQSGWTVLRDKKEVLHQLNNAILDSINNYLHESGESPNIFYRHHKGYTHSDKLLKDMTDDYGLTVTVRGYKILYQTDINNTLYLTKKRRFVKIKRNNNIINKFKYVPVYKRDIDQSFKENINVEIERSKKFENKELSQNIKAIYEQKRLEGNKNVRV